MEILLAILGGGALISVIGNIILFRLQRKAAKEDKKDDENKEENKDDGTTKVLDGNEEQHNTEIKQYLESDEYKQLVGTRADMPFV